MKKFITGFTLGALIFSSSIIYAASGSTLLEVYYNVKDMKINNKSNMPTERPFIYNGTTFVPIRYIAENLGQQVLWDNENQTVKINNCDNYEYIVTDTRPDDHLNFVCISNRKIKLPGDVTNEFISLYTDLPKVGQPTSDWLGPAVVLSKGKSLIRISIKTGIVIAQNIDADDKEPFAFLKPYITGYFPQPQNQ